MAALSVGKSFTNNTGSYNFNENGLLYKSDAAGFCKPETGSIPENKKGNKKTLFKKRSFFFLFSSPVQQGAANPNSTIPVLK